MKNVKHQSEYNLKTAMTNSNCKWFLNLEWKYNNETYTLLRGKALADYQGEYKPEVNWTGVEYLRDYSAIAINREFKQIATAGSDTAAASKFPLKWDTAHVRQLHPAVAWNLTAWVGMFCRSGHYFGFILLLWPFSTDISAF